MFPFEAYSLALLFAFSSWTSCPFSCIFEVFFRGLLYVTSVFEVFIRGLLHFTSIGRVLHFTPIYIRSLFQRSLARHLCRESLALHSRLYLKSFQRSLARHLCRESLALHSHLDFVHRLTSSSSVESSLRFCSTIS